MPVIHRDTDYAIRAVAHIAASKDVLSASWLSGIEDVPADFLRKILQKLKSSGLLSSVQGPTGGYVLCRPAEQISLYDIIVAMQGPVSMNACFDDPGICGNVETCPVRRELESLGEVLRERLDAVLISDVMESFHGSSMKAPHNVNSGKQDSQVPNVKDGERLNTDEDGVKFTFERGENDYGRTNC